MVEHTKLCSHLPAVVERASILAAGGRWRASSLMTYWATHDDRLTAKAGVTTGIPNVMICDD